MALGPLNQTYGDAAGSFRYDPYRQMTGWEGVEVSQNPLVNMAAQMIAGQFMGKGEVPLGLTNQNTYDRMQSWRLQQMHDSLLQDASRRDADTYFQSMRGLARMTGTPWGADQIHAAQSISRTMAAAGPMATQLLPPEVLDAMGGYRGLNVVMADQMFQGGRFRMDPMTGKMGLGEDSQKRLQEDVFNSFFARGTAGRRIGMSAGELGTTFHELQRIGMVGAGPASMQELQGQFAEMDLAHSGLMPGDRRKLQSLRNVMTDAAVGVGADLGMGGGFDPRLVGAEAKLDLRKLSPGQLESMQKNPEVAAALAAFDSKKVVKSLEDYSGVIKSMKEIFGDAGHPNAPLPQLINALNQLTGGALPQLTPGEVENMARSTYNLARGAGISLEGAMVYSQLANQQAMELGLPPIFGAESLQHGLAFRSAFQSMGMGAHPAWGLSGIEQQTAADMQLTSAAAGSKLANQAGVALRMRDRMSAGESSAFKEGSAIQAWVDAVEAGAQTYIDPATGDRKSININEDKFTTMMVEGSNAPIDQSTVRRMILQQDTNLEQVQKYGIADTVRAGQRDEFMQMLTEQVEFNAQEQIASAMPEFDRNSTMALGNQVSSAAMTALGNMSAAQRTDAERRNAIMSAAVRERLESAAAGGIDGVDREASKALLERYNKDESFREIMIEEMYGAAEGVSRDPYSPFGARSLQDSLQLFDADALNRTKQNQVREQVRAMEQTAMSPLGRTGAFRRGIQAVIDADDDTSAADVFKKAFGVESGEEIGEMLAKSGTLDRVRAKQAEFEALSQKYEAASDEERQTMLAPLKASADAYKEAVSETEEVARRNGFYIGTMVEQDDVSRLGRAQDLVRELTGDKTATLDQLRGATSTASRSRRDIVAQMYADPETLGRLGDEGLTHLKNLDSVDSELDALAVMHADGDVAKLLRGEYAEGTTAAEKKEIAQKLSAIGKRETAATAYFASSVSGGPGDYAYLGATKKAIDPILDKLRGTEGAFVSDMGDMLQMTDAELSNLVDAGDLTGGEMEQIKAARGLYDKQQEKIAEAREDYRKSGRDILREGMADLTGKSLDDLSDAAVEEFFGGAERAQALEAQLDEDTPEARRRKAAFSALMEDEEKLREFAKGAGVGFDDKLGFVGDPLDVLKAMPAGPADPKEEDTENQVNIRLDIAEFRINKEAASQLRVEGKGFVEKGRQ